MDPLLALGPRVLIMGDYNARSPAWLDVAYNINGRSLETAFPSLNGILMNDNGPTRVAERPGDSDSCIDLSIATARAVLDLKWKLLPLMGSDHRPILVHLAKGTANKQPRKVQGFRYRK